MEKIRQDGRAARLGAVGIEVSVEHGGALFHVEQAEAAPVRAGRSCLPIHRLQTLRRCLKCAPRGGLPVPAGG